MNTLKQYINELQEVMTLDEIAAQSKVSKKNLIKIKNKRTIKQSIKEGNNIIWLWLNRVYLNG